MRTLALALLTLGMIGLVGAAQAGAGCFRDRSHDKTAETPPPPPPPNPST